MATIESENTGAAKKATRKVNKTQKEETVNVDVALLLATQARQIQELTDALASLRSAMPAPKGRKKKNPIPYWERMPLQPDPKTGVDLIAEYKKLHRDGFITVVVPKTRDPLGAEPLHVGTPDRHIKIHRDHPTCIPIRFLTRIDDAKILGTKLVKRDEFLPENISKYTSVDEVPTMMTQTIPVQSKTYKYRNGVQRRRPSDSELEWAKKVFPQDARLASNYQDYLAAKGENPAG